MNLREGVIETILLVAGLTLAFVYVMMMVVDDIKALHRIKNAGARPTPFRKLSPHEKEILRKLYKHYVYLSILSVCLPGIGAVLMIFLGSLIPDAFLVMAFTAIITIFFSLLAIFLNIRNSIRVRKDLLSEVYEIRGEAYHYNVANIIGAGGRLRLPRYWIYVGSVRFYFTIHDEELWHFFVKVKNNDLVHVTYSPHSKHIWDIKRV